MRNFRVVNKMESYSNEACYVFFSALANRTRLAIIDVLSEDAKTLSEISKALKQKLEVIRQNLKVLEHCVIVYSEDSGEEKLYTLNKEVLAPLSEILTFHTSKYCPDLKECIPEDKLKKYMKQEAAKKTYIEHG
jgi:DNA-binding transcriptional ArsR family regulator